jgi:hypothetical protein
MPPEQVTLRSRDAQNSILVPGDWVTSTRTYDAGVKHIGRIEEIENGGPGVLEDGGTITIRHVGCCERGRISASCNSRLWRKTAIPPKLEKRVLHAMAEVDNIPSAWELVLKGFLE